MNWMEDFLTRCLAGVPEGRYRTRTGQELRDHLASLCRDLERSGHTPEAAQALAIARMGDPAELSRHCRQEWRRRTRWQRWLAAAELICAGLCVMAAGYLYILNPRNFGKGWVVYWGMAAILSTGILLYAFAARYWTLARLACWGLAVIQGPPIFFWIVCFSTFEFTGVMMVPWWLGLAIHLLFLGWAWGNLRLLGRFRREESIAELTPSE